MDDAVVHDLKEEILYLRSLLDANGIKYDFEAYCLEKDARKAESPMIPIDITPETAKFFFSMFHGRAECQNRNWPSLNSSVLMQHMTGKREDCGDVVGVYVMLKDDTCRFIVFDFDNHNEASSEGPVQGFD